MDGWQIGLRQWIHYLSIWILVMLGIRDPIEVRVSFMRLSTILSKLYIIIFCNPPTVAVVPSTPSSIPESGTIRDTQNNSDSFIDSRPTNFLWLEFFRLTKTTTKDAFIFRLLSRLVVQ